MQADSAVAVLAVVVGEELLAERPGIGQGAEPVGEDREVLSLDLSSGRCCWGGVAGVWV